MNETEARFFDDFQRRTIEAAMARIIPTDYQPGASEAGTIDFLDRYLSGIDYVYARPDGSGFMRLEGKRAEAWQSAHRHRPPQVSGRYRRAESAKPRRVRWRVRRAGRRSAGRHLTMMERPDHDEERAREEEQASRGFAPPEPGLQQMRSEAISTSSPCSSCTPGRGSTPTRSTAATGSTPVGRPSGFPVPARWPRRTLVATPRCRTLRPAQPGLERGSRVTAKRKPDPVDVCIIGAGASGATAAKVLTEGGLSVVMLEKGPWRKPESFGGDELANVHRFNLWPDPISNPRTFRAAADEPARVELFCPCRRWSAAALPTGPDGSCA